MTGDEGAGLMPDMDLTIYRPGKEPERVELATYMLGLYPYVVIEARPASDGSGEPALYATPGGGAEEDLSVLPVLLITSLPAADNPITRELVRLRDVVAGSDLSPEYVIDKVAEALGVEMPEGS